MGKPWEGVLMLRKSILKLSFCPFEGRVQDFTTRCLDGFSALTGKWGSVYG